MSRLRTNGRTIASRCGDEVAWCSGASRVRNGPSRLTRNKPTPRKNHPTDLMRQGRLEEARVAWQTALEGNPLDHNAWYGYAELCLFLGREDEYRRARQDLLARFVTTSNPYFAGTHRPGVSAPARDPRRSSARPWPSSAAPRPPTCRTAHGLTPSSCSPRAWRNTVRGGSIGRSPRCAGTPQGARGRPPTGSRHGSAPQRTVGGSTENAGGDRPDLRLEGPAGARPGRLDLPCASPRGRGHDPPELAGLPGREVPTPGR